MDRLNKEMTTMDLIVTFGAVQRDDGPHGSKN